MGPVKSDVCGSLVMEFEEDDLSPAQLDHKLNIEQKIDILNSHIQELHSNLQSLKAEVSSDPPPIPAHVVQIQHPAQVPVVNQTSQNAASSANYVVVDSGSGLVALPTRRSPAGITPVRYQTPGNSLLRAPGSKVSPARGMRGGTAIRQRRGFARGGANNMGARMPIKAAETAPKRRLEKKSDVVDLTDEDLAVETEVPSKADMKEVTISPHSEKTFPSLVVLARPYLSPKQFTNQQIQMERTSLDEKVKQVLTLSTSKFSEWLLQHGMLRSEQECNSNIKGKGHLPLKLGMYSDTSKFPYSGGYVWISECCPSHFLSVFSGSLFEATPHSPGIVLKLVYHWACQTAVQNVIQWVKVDNLFVKTLYTNLRAVCTAAIHEKFPVFGGPSLRVQIGVISLGTTAQDGSSRQVKVEILGIYDETTKMLRIRAIEPVSSDKSEDQITIMKKRFVKALEPLLRWVHKSSEVVIDCTVDKGTLVSYGYSKVTQVSGDQTSSYKIMDYLKVVIPRMFQNTLSLLSRQIIQQFLDELVWREAFGPMPSRAFESIIEHVSEQTRLNTGGTLVNRLSRISLNPFRNWEYDMWINNCRPNVPSKSNAGGYRKVLVPASPEVGISSLPSTSSAGGNRKVLAPASPESGSLLPSTSSVYPKPYAKKPLPVVHMMTSETPPKVIPKIENVETSVALPSQVSNISSIKAKPPISEHGMIGLEPYYYGILEGDSSKHRYVPFFTQCYLCRSDFKSASKLTDHLILHALNKNLESVSDPKDLCKVCLKLRLPGSKQHHVLTCGLGGPTGLCCKICNTKMKDNGSLIYHMTKTHNQLDLPYRCNRCNYRVSELQALNSHFAKSNGVTGMCPYCLKLVDFATPGGDDLEHNQLFFIKHIQRHVLPSSKSCSRCLLNFINKWLLADHEKEAHASCADNDDVMRYLVDQPILMPAPISEPGLEHMLKEADLRPASQLKGISTVSLKVSAIIDCTDITCHECESTVTPEHFSNFLMCNKCSFRTCCPHAISEHVAQMHPPYTLSSPVYIGMKVLISSKLYCSSCPFSSRDGNIMCTHLVTCGTGTAMVGRRRLPPPEDLESLSLEHISRKRSRKSKNKDENPKTILNSLGLVRKEDEELGASLSESVVEEGRVVKEKKHLCQKNVQEQDKAFKRKERSLKGKKTSNMTNRENPKIRPQWILDRNCRAQLQSTPVPTLSEGPGSSGSRSRGLRPGLKIKRKKSDLVKTIKNMQSEMRKLKQMYWTSQKQVQQLQKDQLKNKFQGKKC